MLKDSPEVLTSCGLEPGLERHSLHMIAWIDQVDTTSHCKLRAYFFYLSSSQNLPLWVPNMTHLDSGGIFLNFLLALSYLLR